MSHTGQESGRAPWKHETAEETRRAQRAPECLIREYGRRCMVSRMKTTIEIPDALAEEARDLARAQRSTLRDLVVTGLRHEVERRREVTVADFHFPTVAGEGLAIGISPREAIERSYDLTP